MTPEEFKETITSGWEMDFLLDGSEYHYQRAGEQGVFHVYLTKDGEILLDELADDMPQILEQVLSLLTGEGTAFEQVEPKIIVISAT